VNFLLFAHTDPLSASNSDKGCAVVGEGAKAGIEWEKGKRPKNPWLDQVLRRFLEAASPGLRSSSG
jgi:hypothetical protein